MPPSPWLRCSPARENRMENHKQGPSVESASHFKDKDDDLALFNDMQTREMDNFLLHTAEDFDDSLSTKLRYFSDFKLGISIPVRGESSDLNADGEKNDYDWLLTPPDTPLFPSLDDETPPVNVTHRGRPRSQPISITRSATTEKTYKMSRSSASPNRLSPSPRSGNTTFQSRGRAASAPHSSPPPVLRQTTPSRRSSTPPNKPATPSPRSSTPTPQRMPTGSSSQSSARRGTSPVKVSRRNSTSPKLRAWQNNLPGFSLDPPPNLRTSLSDRAASNTRGLSPASRNGKNSSSKFGRQSISPIASRSISSSHSPDRDRFSSQSKGSVVSSGDDDVNSPHYVMVGTRKNGAFPNSRSIVFSKKPSRTISASSAPKSSFDSAIRQMDHRKSPQTMFRPLLSSVPATTFYVGKANTAHRPMFSRNSSITTSSNASSELCASFAPDTEDSEHDQDNKTSGWEKATYSDAQEEVFMFDKVDEEIEYIGNDVCDGKSIVGHVNIDKRFIDGLEPKEIKKDLSSLAVEAISATTCESSEADCYKMISCSKCGRNFHIMEHMDENVDICQECSEKIGMLDSETPEATVVLLQNNEIQSEMGVEENKLHDLGLEMGILELLDKASKTTIGKKESNGGHEKSDDDIYGQQLQLLNVRPSLKENSEGAGISVLLLKRSSSAKWPFVQGRALTVAHIQCDDPSYARDSRHATKGCIGQGSASSSSSVDLSSSRQTEAHVQCQLSSRKADFENSRKSRSTGSSFSEISHIAGQSLVHVKNTNEEHFSDSAGNMESNNLEERKILSVTEEHGRTLGNTESSGSSSIGKCEEDKLEHTDICRVMDATSTELSSHARSIQLEDTSLKFLNCEDCVSSGYADDVLPYSARSISDIGVSRISAESSVIEGGDILNSGAAATEDASDSPPHGSSVAILREVENGHEKTVGSQTKHGASPNSKSIIEASLETLISTTSDQDVFISDPQSNISDVHGESTITIDAPRRHKSKSLTLDEATDTILFCSSIVHNLAYQAATIGMEKEKSIPLEGSRPTVTILGKSSPSKNDPRCQTPSKRTPKSQKTRRRLLDADVKTNPSIKIEKDENIKETLSQDTVVRDEVDSLKPPNLESKCNCTVM